MMCVVTKVAILFLWKFHHQIQSLHSVDLVQSGNFNALLAVIILVCDLFRFHEKNKFCRFSWSAKTVTLDFSYDEESIDTKLGISCNMVWAIWFLLNLVASLITSWIYCWRMSAGPCNSLSNPKKKNINNISTLEKSSKFGIYLITCHNFCLDVLLLCKWFDACCYFEFPLFSFPHDSILSVLFW